jgi:hypothetical protein
MFQHAAKPRDKVLLTIEAQLSVEVIFDAIFQKRKR